MEKNLLKEKKEKRLFRFLVHECIKKKAFMSCNK